MGTSSIGSLGLNNAFNTGMDGNLGIGGNQDNDIDEKAVGSEKGVEQQPLAPANQENAVEADHNPGFPQQEEPAIMPEHGGVGNLKDIVGDAPVDEHGDLYDMQSTAGVHTMVRKSVEGVTLQFQNLVKADAKIAALENAIAKLPENERGQYEADLNKLKDYGKEVNYQAKTLTGFLQGEENAVWHGLVDKLNEKRETESQREARLQTEIDNMRVSLRNFRSDFESFINRKDGVLKSLSRAGNYIRNVFTTSRNRFFGWFTSQKQQYVSKNTWANFQDAKDRFDGAFEELARSLSGNPALSDLDAKEALSSDFNVGNLDQIDDYMTHVADMIENKQSDSIADMCLKSVKDQLRNIAENGGYKLMELELGVGFGIHFTDNAEATVGGKGKYLYKVFGTGDGSLTIEHVGQAGADIRGKLRVGDILQVDGQGNAIIGGGKSYQYRDVDSAARSVFTIDGKESKFFKHGVARFNPLFIKGRGIGNNLAFGLKYLGLGLLSLPKLLVRGLGRLIDWAYYSNNQKHLFDTFDPNRHFKSDRDYFSSLKSRGVLKRADRLLVPRKNILMTGSRTFGRLNAGLGGAVKSHVGPSRLRLDGSVDASHDFKAKKTNYRTLMTYLTNEQNGECLKRALKLRDSGRSLFPLETSRNLDLMDDVQGGGTLENEILDILQLDAKSLHGEDARAAAKRILDLLPKMVEAEELYGVAFEEKPEGSKDYQEAAKDYRNAMLTAAALLEQFGNLHLEAEDGELANSFDELREKLMASLENPAVFFPQKVFQDNFFVQHTTDDGKLVLKQEYFFEYDALGDLKSNMLENTALHDALGAGEGGVGGVMKNVELGKTLGRSGAFGAVEGVSKSVGLQGSVGVTITEEVPTGEGKKAPWLYSSHKTYDLQFSANTTFDNIMRHCMKTLCKEAGIPYPEQGNWKEILSNQLIGGVASSIMRAFSDVMAKYYGKGPDESIATGDRNFVNGGRDSDDPDQWFKGLDFWRTGSTVQFEFFDGRLSAVNFGSGEKMSVKVGLPLGPVVIHGGYRFESLENKNSFWMHPSFDALLNKCDSMLGQGNRTMWKHFALRNQAGLVRMADVYAKHIGGGDIGKDEPLAADANATDDLKRIGEMRSRIARLMENPQVEARPALQRRLQLNYSQLRQAEAALADVCAQHDALLRDQALSEDERKARSRELQQPKMLAMRTVLELTVRQFDILQSGDADLELEFSPPQEAVIKVGGMSIRGVVDPARASGGGANLSLEGSASFAS